MHLKADTDDPKRAESHDPQVLKHDQCCLKFISHSIFDVLLYFLVTFPSFSLLTRDAENHAFYLYIQTHVKKKGKIQMITGTHQLLQYLQ